MCNSNAYEHIGAVRRTESVPGGHLIGGTQSVPVPVLVPQDKNGQPAILGKKEKYEREHLRGTGTR